MQLLSHTFPCVLGPSKAARLPLCSSHTAFGSWLRKLLCEKNMNLNELKDKEIVTLYSDIIIELKKRKIIRTKNLLGDLGEYLAIDYYCNTPGLTNLQVAPAGTQNIDAISRKGERYSIKSTSGNLTSVFYGLNDPESTEEERQKFEYVIIVLFTDDFKLKKILEVPWTLFLTHKRWHKTMRGWNISITKKLIREATVVFSSEEK